MTRLGGVGIAEVVDHLDREQVARLADSGARGARPPRRAGERHLGRRGAEGRAAAVEHPDLGARPRRRAAHPAPRHRHAPHHVAPPAAAAHRAARAACSSRSPTAPTTTTRRTTGSPSSTTWPRSSVNRLAFSQGHELGDARRHRRRPHAGLAALRDDARGLRGHRGDLARRPGARRPARLRPVRVTPLRRPRRRGAGRRRRPSALEPAVASPPRSSRRSTASPTSTAPSPTPGA